MGIGRLKKISIIPRSETNVFRARHNLKDTDVAEMLKCLTIEDFAKTEPDRDLNYKGECWFFYKQFELSDRPVRVYIKLKITERVVIISFHDAMYELVRPYAGMCCGDP